MRLAARASLAAAVAAIAALAPAPAGAATGCRTPVAADGHEPRCNPHLADSPWGGAHRASYAQASSPHPAPADASTIVYDRVDLGGTHVPIVISFSSPYADGGRVAWMSVVSRPDVQGVFKVDVATGDVIDTLQREPATAGGLISGAYSLLDRDDHLFVGRARALEVFGDERPGERASPIAMLKRFDLPERAFCGPDDSMVGITMTYDGHVAFATERGVVGVVPRRLDRLDDAHLRTHSINAEACASGAEGLDTVSNSIAADEQGGIYVVTSNAQYRIQWDGERLRRRWRAAYETGGDRSDSGVRLGEGSGATPTLMGTHPGDDRFVVITDGQPLMHLVLMWRGRIPRDWEPIAPGKDRRIACEVPVTFGDPEAAESSSEQSVLVRGNASVVVNNKLRNEAAFGALPPAQRQIAAALAGQDPVNAPYGLERIDWDPLTRTCASRWANPTVSIPNAIPTMSAASGLVYGQGQRNGVWGLEGVDFATGRSALRVDTVADVRGNSIYAATTVGPDNAIWQGAGGGIEVYRGPQAPAPDVEPRGSRGRLIRSLRVRGRDRRVVVRLRLRRAARVRMVVRRRGEVVRRTGPRRRGAGVHRLRIRGLAPGRHRVQARARAGTARDARSRRVRVRRG